ncbi:MAG: sugar kinase, partial [Clostridia bacterium]|nr:sugar kinase [Clostridia bacterium]
MENYIFDKEFDVLSIGEVMLRLSPVGKERISHCETFEKNAGGSELNVVSGISMLGLRTGIITKLPHNEIGKFIRRKIRYGGTSDDFVVYDDSPDMRLGIYYYESGAYPRPSIVSYDRARSSFTSFEPKDVPRLVYSSAAIFHASGITLALGGGIRESVISMMRGFSEAGALISFDVNYRAALWDEADARETVLRVLPLVDVLFVSEETSRRMLGMEGELKEIHKKISEKYPNLKIIASTKRKVLSPQRHSFSSLVYDCKEEYHFEEAAYENIDVVDRIGSGDAYIAGALYALCKFRSIEQMAMYGDAMAALKNTVIGDITECDIIDIERIIGRHIASGPISEMER